MRLALMDWIRTREFELGSAFKTLKILVQANASVGIDAEPDEDSMREDVQGGETPVPTLGLAVDEGDSPRHDKVDDSSRRDEEDEHLSGRSTWDEGEEGRWEGEDLSRRGEEDAEGRWSPREEDNEDLSGRDEDDAGRWSHREEEDEDLSRSEDTLQEQGVESMTTTTTSTTTSTEAS